MSYLVTIKASFSAAHFYNQKKWSETQNKEKFGKCFSPYGHGHDYKIKVYFSKSSLNLKSEKNVLREFCESLDHKHLNFEVPHFKDQIPTTENIASFCMQKLESLFRQKIVKIELFERADLYTCIENT